MAHAVSTYRSNVHCRLMTNLPGEPANSALNHRPCLPTVVLALPLSDQVSQDKIRTLVVVDEVLPRPRKTPCFLSLAICQVTQQQAEGKQNRSLFPSPCFQAPLKFPWHQQNRERRKKKKTPGSICRKTPPSPLVASFTSRYVLRAWSRIFQLTASPSIYTLSSCIPFVKIIS